MALAQTVAPGAWARTLSGAPVVDRHIPAVVPALVRRWQGIDPQIDQAALDHHFLSIHLGGAKRLSRRGEGVSKTSDVPDGAHSVVPAGAAFQWDTEGPVDFVHIYFEPLIVDRVIVDAFDRDPASLCLHDNLGAIDPLISSLVESLLDELRSDDETMHRAYLDDMLHLLLCRAIRLHTDVGDVGERARHVLAPYRLRRAIEFIDAHLAEDIGVEQIAEASGISRYHFSRAFRQTTGRAPYAYLLDQRIAAARKMLIATDETTTIVAARCGFSGPSQFSRLFKRATGVTPSGFRQQY